MKSTTAKAKLSHAMAYLFRNRVYRTRCAWVDEAAHEAYMILFEAHCQL